MAIVAASDRERISLHVFQGRKLHVDDKNFAYQEGNRAALQI